MQKKLLAAMTRALFDTDLVASRIILAMAEFLWAILLLWPGETFGRPTYKIMSHVMAEEAWGLVFLMSGVAQITIVLSEIFHSMFAKVFAGWNAMLWVYVVASMLLSVYPPPAAISGEMALAVAATWIWIRPYIIYEGIVRARQQHSRF